MRAIVVQVYGFYSGHKRVIQVLLTVLQQARASAIQVLRVLQRNCLCCIIQGILGVVQAHAVYCHWFHMLYFISLFVCLSLFSSSSSISIRTAPALIPSKAALYLSPAHWLKTQETHIIMYPLVFLCMTYPFPISSYPYNLTCINNRYVH